MELLYEILPIILYFLGAVLLVVITMLVIRLIDTVDKVNTLLDDIEAKSQSLNGLFDAIDSVGNTISSVNMKVVGTITNVIERLFHKRKTKNKKIKEENEDYE